MTRITKIYPYVVISLDLSDARADLAQGSVTLRGDIISPWKANVLSVITLDGGTLSFKLNNSDNDTIQGSDNLKTEGNIFTDILWTNTAQAGKTANIYVSWVD